MYFANIPQPVTELAQVLRRELEDALRTRNERRIRLAVSLMPTIPATDRQSAVVEVLKRAGRELMSIRY